MRPSALILGAACVLAAVASARADVVIASDNGGMIGDYVVRFDRVRQSGQNVVIDGPCLSACTLVLGLVPRSRVCATRNAVLGFHAAWNPDRAGRKITSPIATRTLMSMYPAHVQRWIAQRGGLTPKMMLMQGRDLASAVPPCEADRTMRAQAPGPSQLRREAGVPSALPSSRAAADPR